MSTGSSLPSCWLEKYINTSPWGGETRWRRREAPVVCNMVVLGCIHRDWPTLKQHKGLNWQRLQKSTRIGGLFCNESPFHYKVMKVSFWMTSCCVREKVEHVYFSYCAMTGQLISDLSAAARNTNNGKLWRVLKKWKTGGCSSHLFDRLIKIVSLSGAG